MEKSLGVQVPPSPFFQKQLSKELFFAVIVVFQEFKCSLTLSRSEIVSGSLKILIKFFIKSSNFVPLSTIKKGITYVIPFLIYLSGEGFNTFIEGSADFRTDAV